MVKGWFLIVLCCPLLGALLSGLGGRRLSDATCHRLTIVLMSIATAVSAGLLLHNGLSIVPTQQEYYQWGVSGPFAFHIGLYWDALTAVMTLCVTSVALLVHIYSIGYMAGDPGYARFFSHVSLFTFFMLLLVAADNLFQLFIGWEGVGLVSYLLIGFWFQKTSAAQGGFKAFVVNRVGDFGLILAMAALIEFCGSLDYSVIFAQLPSLSGQTLILWPGAASSHLITVVCVLLLIAAMGKSAQMPLHVWLPESMEGPTPISALIHAATMVTAGIFLIARLSPLFVHSAIASTAVLWVGTLGALFLGLLAVVENDIKRIIAFSTMSQLGYMMAANGVMAYPFAVFHLLTHAAFKALLFLAAGSVIIACHHKQDIRQMGGLWRRLPITYITFWVGALSLSAIPPFSGFFSKENILAAVEHAALPGAFAAYLLLCLGSLVTAFYSFRLIFRVFHGALPADLSSVREPHSTMTVVCIILAVPSLALGAWLLPIWLRQPATWSAASPGVWQGEGVVSMLQHAVFAWPVWMAVTGGLLAWWVVARGANRHATGRLAAVLQARYGIDALYQRCFVDGFQAMARWLLSRGDEGVIDRQCVGGLVRCAQRFSTLLRQTQTGYLTQSVFVMLVALAVCVLLLVLTKLVVVRW